MLIRRLLVSTALSMVIVLCLGMVTVGGQKRFDGVKIVVFGDAGHNLRPFEWYKDEIKQVSGIEISQIVGVPFNSVYEKLKTEFVAQTGAYDLVVFYPAFIGEFAGLGYLAPLDQYAAKYDPKMSDVAEAFRELYCKYQGKLYTLPYDGDVLNLYYRKDLFANAEEKAAFKKQYGYDLAPPETWDDWLKVAKFFTRKKGEKLAGHALAEDFYGCAEMGGRGYSFAWWLARFASLGGVYFDENMKPMINDDRAVKALENMRESIKYCPPDVLAYGYEELKNAFIEGKVAMVMQWPCVGKKGSDPKQSKIVGLVGIAPVPGYKVGGKVVRKAPMPVGRVLAVAKTSRNPEAAYWVARYLSVEKSILDVSSPDTGLDPYRYSHFNNPKAFAKIMGKEDVAKEYLEAVQFDLDNGFPEINIPGAWSYEDVLDLQISRVLSGQAAAKPALDVVAKEWDGITDKLGAATQKEIYNQMLDSWRALGLWK